MNTLLHDLRYSLRMLLKHPGFSVVAMLTLGVAIGANTAIFSGIQALLSDPFPYSDRARLVQLQQQKPAIEPTPQNQHPGARLAGAVSPAGSPHAGLRV